MNVPHGVAIMDEGKTYFPLKNSANYICSDEKSDVANENAAAYLASEDNLAQTISDNIPHVHANTDEMLFTTKIFPCDEAILKKFFTSFLFNVGGSHFQLSFLNVLRSGTLSSMVKSEFFADTEWKNASAVLQDDTDFHKKRDGIFIDRDPGMFTHLVRYLRTGELDLSSLFGANQSNNVNLSTTISLTALQKEFTYFAVEWPEQCFHCSSLFDPKRNNGSSCSCHPGKVNCVELPNLSKRLLYDCCYRMQSSPGCQKAPHLSDYQATDWLMSTVHLQSHDMPSFKKNANLAGSTNLKNPFEHNDKVIEEYKEENAMLLLAMQPEKQVSTTNTKQEFSATSLYTEVTLKGHEGEEDQEIILSPRVEPISLTDSAPAIWRVAPEEGTEMPLVMESVAAKKSQNGKMKIELDTTSCTDLKDSNSASKCFPDLLRNATISQAHLERDLGCLRDDNLRSNSSSNQLYYCNDEQNLWKRSASKNTPHDTSSLQKVDHTVKVVPCTQKSAIENSETGAEELESHEEKLNSQVQHSMGPWRMQAVPREKAMSRSATKITENESDQSGVSSVDDLNRCQHPLYKTKMCPFMKNGSCPKKPENCNFAHSLEDLRSTNNFRKTKMCAFWLSGYCRAGTYCRHAHGEDEIRYRDGGTLQPIMTPVDHKIIWFRLGGYCKPISVADIPPPMIPSPDNLYMWQ
ncbi:zinc finger (CCCH type) motif-containing protein [Cardiosporidium cionae]|uniref:Zinc finger (CCCH type) motif-containing protein n=1 Tax=Cardiosporidium cionae TaxID=476202 RepID=A0ABQ7JB03_9APIC|nr:zinc finger (CCCH type) motif-containing protein [Cardiosporidium cionae]|eukprot:KAF8821099.1 zinc finger (CCCH type) motif-containing protein [Cardiosporidium cionae]